MHMQNEKILCVTIRMTKKVVRNDVATKKVVRNEKSCA